VRGFVIAQFHSLGYRTAAVDDGRAALEYVDSGQPFDLLFTDVVMPGGMTGRQLADKVSRRQPGTKVLYTSGYTEKANVHHGRIDQDVMLLSKPYRKSELAGIGAAGVGDIHTGLLESQPIPLADTSIGAPTRRQRANASSAFFRLRTSFSVSLRLSRYACSKVTSAVRAASPVAFEADRRSDAADCRGGFDRIPICT